MRDRDFASRRRARIEASNLELVRGGDSERCQWSMEQGGRILRCVRRGEHRGHAVGGWKPPAERIAAKLDSFRRDLFSYEFPGAIQCCAVSPFGEFCRQSFGHRGPHQAASGGRWIDPPKPSGDVA